MHTHTTNQNELYQFDTHICDEFIARWDKPLVLRSRVYEFSCGLLHPRTMANLDALGKGPEKRIIYGRKIAYRTNVLADWIKRNIREILAY